tara:strand:+ start:242 stop:1156 length:915 start_codon:yes stop_codon:yes gene_type:complete
MSFLRLYSDINILEARFMLIYIKILTALSLFFLISCSASYDKLSKGSFEPNDDFSKFLLKNYKQKADFEAKEMHDWDSAKLYSEKALAAVDGAKILPQKISYWKIAEDKKNDLVKAYNDIIKIYDEAIVSNPFYLAKAISSLDCWSEQQEENWQTWDIDQCRDDYISSMRKIYNIIDKKKDSLYSNSIKENIIHKNIKQIVYFDFNESKLTTINKAEITNFILLDKNLIKKYIVIGHTDTKGNKKYNYNLSLDRAEQVKKFLVLLNIKKENITILGKGEDDLKILTEDGIKHTANRRAEISPLN